VTPFWKALIGMSLFIVAAIWSGLTVPDDVAAQIKPYVGNWHYSVQLAPARPSPSRGTRERFTSPGTSMKVT
jgi:hypothetical protein